MFPIMLRDVISTTDFSKRLPFTVNHFPQTLPTKSMISLKFAGRGLQRMYFFNKLNTMRISLNNYVIDYIYKFFLQQKKFYVVY